jgi:hypothetical protein
MSTSDTDTWDANVCPCGASKILKHITNEDNSWSRPRIAYELQYPACAALGWGLESTGVSLVLRDTEVALRRANDAWTWMRAFGGNMSF